jgi:peptide/nickel transport system ATP-binding protein
MEAGNVDSIIRDPQHPYTRLLVSSIPWPDPALPWGEALEGGGVEEIIQKSQVAFAEITGCKFAPRCPHVMDVCHTEPPALFRMEKDRAAACYLYQDNESLARADLNQVFVES